MEIYGKKADLRFERKYDFYNKKLKAVERIQRVYRGFRARRVALRIR